MRSLNKDYLAIYVFNVVQTFIYKIDSDPQIDRNGFQYIISGDLLLYLFGGLYIICLTRSKPLHAHSLMTEPDGASWPHLTPEEQTRLECE